MVACNFYRRHIHNFTYSSAPLTDLIKKTTPWRWTAREEECFQELKKKIASSNCLGVPLKRYPEPVAHGPEACEPSHPLWPMARRPVSRHTCAEAVDTGCQRDIPVL